MPYATRDDIEATYGVQITQMVVDHGLNVIEDAEDTLNDLVSAGADQVDIDNAQDALDLAIANKEPSAEATITKNLEIGAAKIDGFIKARYPHVWTTPPTLLKTLNETIAVYWMALAADWRTDEMKERYKDALETLADIRDGKIDLTGGETQDETVEPVQTGLITLGKWSRG